MSSLQILTSIFFTIAVVYGLWKFYRPRHSSVTSAALVEQSFDQAWWIIVRTEQPSYEYFFGPFESRQVAVTEQSGYVKDLYDEGATNIKSFIRWCQPEAITSPVS